PEKRLTLDGMKQRYSMEEKFRRELDDMIYMGRIQKSGDFYVNTAKGLIHVKVMNFLRNYLHLGGHQ
ncbi:MAG: hypothetical protein PHS37_10045, partial [Candidatus Omnitrophica bacterium]|nr:hypothetical protein [Candidatus Omnitrophota bacterium]